MSDSNKTIRTRLAPSPTGMIHVGTARIALFNYLFTKHNNGKFVLRIEDTDQARLVEGALENLIEVIGKLGIEFDEGPYLDSEGKIQERGEFGPYIQSKRLDIYPKYVEQLLQSGKAYYCFCSKERLDEVRAEQTALKQPPMYDRLCRNLSESEVTAKQAEFKASGKQPVVRQAIPLEGETIIDDLIYGQIKYENKLLDDHILIKADGFPTYHFAVVIDDHLMEITHIFRGEEWLPSAPRHALLFQSFGWEAPSFVHMPLILNADKTKLSKRKGDVSVESFFNKGYLPEGLLNFMVLLGWNPKTEQEIFSMQDLIDQFDLAKVHNSGAVFDIAKLDWMNSHYIRAKSNEELLELLKPILAKEGIELDNFKSEYLLAVVEIEKERLKTLSQILDHAGFYFAEPQYDPDILVWKKADKEDAKKKLTMVKEFLSSLSAEDFALTQIEEKIKEWIKMQLLETGNVLWPLRTSLTGLQKSPSPFEMLSVLYQKDGLETINKRLDKAINLL